MVNHPFAGHSSSPSLSTSRSRSPARPAPRPPALPPQDALRALLHTLLHVTLQDGRVLTGHLIAVDARASLLLSSVRETRVLPPTDVGANVAKYYPFSRSEGGVSVGIGAGLGAGISGARGDVGGPQGPQEEGFVRERELASVLVPMRHVVAVEMGDEDADAWGRFAGVRFEGGVAVPPQQVAAGVA